MSDATYVLWAPRSKSGKLRQVLQSEDTGEIRWTEKRMLFGSEFYFSGPSKLVRATHAYITQWLASDL